MLVRLCALDSVDMEPMRVDLMARLEHHRDRLARYERVLKKRFPHGAPSLDDTGKLLALHLGLRHERAVVEWCEEALQTLQPGMGTTNVTPIGAAKSEGRNEV